MNPREEAELVEAIHSHKPITGLTHGFYRYPARFSPLFARAGIRSFTKPGDLVLDPFMGGGTTLVEAQTLGRRAIGTDTNTLAVFIAKVKTTLLSEIDLSIVRLWVDDVICNLNLRNPPARATEWAKLGYQRNINSKSTWPLRKTLELGLVHINELRKVEQQNFARCVLLKTAQWALDCRTYIPSASQFRKQLLLNAKEMIESAREYAALVGESKHRNGQQPPLPIFCLNRSAAGIETDDTLSNEGAPALIITSPPYPGVHVLYHRWQVQGRKETPAPFWIADTLDGAGASFYTFGDRKQEDLTGYYSQARTVFTSLARIANKKTLVVQLVAFSDPSWQLSRYLSVMEQAGFNEIYFPFLANSSDGRIWRRVPNRKWYANQRAEIATSKEVVLFHKLA